MDHKLANERQSLARRLGRLRASRKIAVVGLSVALVASTASIAAAVISGTTTPTVVTIVSPAPASVKLNALENATKVYAFNERQGVTLTSNLTVDATTAGTYSSFTSATIPSGTVVDSHLIHSDVTSSHPTTHRTGSVTFATPIIGIVATTSRLKATDSLLGATSPPNPVATQYETTSPYRGLESSEGSGAGGDKITFSGNTLSFDFNTLIMDEVRVITRHNAPPTATGDSYQTNQGTALNVSASGVLTNDTDPDGPAPLTAVLVTNPSKGTLALSANGSFIYTPTATATGTDSFTYQAKDGAGALSNTATVTISLNQAPVANADSFSTNADTALNASIATDVTDDGPPPLTFSVVDSPSHGTLTLNSDGSFTYTPDSGYSDTTTPDSFTYNATDGAGAVSNTATVNITVFPVISFAGPVTVTDGDVTGTFTLLTPDSEKRYTAGANAEDHTILFDPSGSDAQVDYRGVLEFGADATTPGLLNDQPLEYDPLGGTDYRPLPWCVDPQFDGSGNVTSATIPVGDTWCIASANTQAGASGQATTIWQVFGHDDPNFRH